MIRVLLPLAIAVLLVACTPEAEDDAGQDATGTGDVVTVTLTEHEIELSGDASAGEVTFELDNEGEQAHGFAIEGTETSDVLASAVEAGSTERVTIELAPGTYTVWCPIGDHRDLGMEAQLDVGDAGGS